MAVREIEVRLRVQVPVGADAATVERVVVQAGREATKEALRQAIEEDEESPTACPKCGKGGR